MEKGAKLAPTIGKQGLSGDAVTHHPLGGVKADGKTERTMPRLARAACALSVLLLSLCPARLPAPPEPDFPWTADAVLEKERQLPLEGLGAAQGATLFDGKVYIYGDVYDARPRVGVIREYTADFQPTGRVLWLRRENKPLLLHPTG